MTPSRSVLLPLLLRVFVSVLLIELYPSLTSVSRLLWLYLVFIYTVVLAAFTWTKMSRDSSVLKSSVMESEKL